MCSQGETQHSTQSVRILSLCGDIKVVITNPIFEGIDVKHNQILSFKTFTLQSWDELRYIRSHQANFTDGTNMRPEANFNSKFSFFPNIFHVNNILATLFNPGT